MSNARDARRFRAAERTALYLAADGKCANCQTPLAPSWHADHVNAWTKGGPTDVINGQALCPPCNLEKGSDVTGTDITLREWQKNALEDFDNQPQDFLVVATPGAGKTAFALAAAEQLLATGYQQIVVVVPTSHLRTQWAKAAARFGIQLDHRFTNGAAVLATDYDGAVITYATVATSPLLWRKISSDRTTLVILDEIHHAGDAEHLAWGSALQEAFEPARRRLLLSGTPFRSDGNPIPFVNYDQQGRCIPGFNYDYGQALVDGGVVRPVEFLALNGEVQWRNAGAVHSAVLDEVPDPLLSQALLAALNPDGDWIPSVLRKADAELTRQRVEMPDAGGLVIASDQMAARQYAAEMKLITGEIPVIAVSDDPDASDNITRFANGDQRWIIAVKMVSEGVDIPRLSVGVYATNTRSEMFVRQVVGRFVRKRGPEDEMSATLFIPSIQPLLRFAASIERTVDAAMLREIEARQAEAKQAMEPRQFDLTEPLASSEAVRHSAMYRNETYEDAELRRAEEAIRLAELPTSISAVQIARLLRVTGAGRVIGTAVIAPEHLPPVPLADQKKAQRKLITRLVGRLNRATGTEHRYIHTDLNRKCGGSIDQATADQLDRRIELLNDWLAQQ